MAMERVLTELSEGEDEPDDVETDTEEEAIVEDENQSSDSEK